MPRADAPNSAGGTAGARPPAFDATLGLGSNLGDRVGNIEEAVRRLTADGSVRLVARSKLYRTAPWGVTDQDWFVNACIAVATELAPHALLKLCQSVENGMGRVRTRHWGPRNIDVDILTFRDLKVRDPDLVIPHPLIAERAFVLLPLKDVAPDLKIGGATLDALIAKLDTRDVALLEA
jgi:2-amino-4-hydroxy-6-hydroxymethyldihydropteridine diphosphokinase